MTLLGGWKASGAYHSVPRLNCSVALILWIFGAKLCMAERERDENTRLRNGPHARWRLLLSTESRQQTLMERADCCRDKRDAAVAEASMMAQLHHPNLIAWVLSGVFAHCD
jgi:hypothetical protein